MWDGRSSAGSKVLYMCSASYYPESGQGSFISTCSETGEWGQVPLNCRGTVLIKHFTSPFHAMFAFDQFLVPIEVPNDPNTCLIRYFYHAKLSLSRLGTPCNLTVLPV